MTACKSDTPLWLALDRRALIAWRTLAHTPAGDRIAAAMSSVADHGRGWVAAGAAGAILDPGRRRRWVSAVGVVLVAEQASRQIKRSVRRPRPQLDGLEPLAGVTARYSFPSSHTATAVAAIYAFQGLLPRAGLVAWALLTAVSRPYLGVHYPSDVAFGALLGATVGKAGQAVTDRLSGVLVRPYPAGHGVRR